MSSTEPAGSMLVQPAAGAVQVAATAPIDPFAVEQLLAAQIALL